MENITLKFRGSGVPYCKTFTFDDDGFVIAEYFSDTNGVAKPVVQVDPEDDRAARGRRSSLLPPPGRRISGPQAVGGRQPRTANAPDPNIVFRFLQPELPCFFDGCETLRAELARDIEAAGGEDCKNCVRSNLEAQYSARAFELWKSQNPVIES